MTSERPPGSEAPTEWPHHSTDLDVLSGVFRRFGEVECKQIKSPLYERLSLSIADDPDMLRFAATRREGQPPPNILYGAVQYLLRSGANHRLRDYYPALTTTPSPPDDAYAAFRDFCLTHEAELHKLMAARTVQTNVVRRSVCLLPAYAVISRLGSGRPLAQIEVGASAGLNLLWQQYRYRYGGDMTWGPVESPVSLSTELRGDVSLPSLPAALRTSWSAGIDLNPISVSDADEVMWLRSLVWPENVTLHQQLTAAIEVAQRNRPRVVKGEASALLPDLLEEAPEDTTLCVYASHALIQFPRDALLALLKSMQAHSELRPVYFVSMEGTGNAHSELKLTCYENGDRRTIDLANCHPHGYWLEWLYASDGV